MPISRALVATPSASSYLQQLCKHWGHRFAVEFTPEEGRIDFANGKTLALTADAGVLTMTVEVQEAGDLEAFETVVTNHLLRFAFRAPPEVVWAPLP